MRRLTHFAATSAAISTLASILTTACSACAQSTVEPPPATPPASTPPTAATPTTVPSASAPDVPPDAIPPEGWPDDYDYQFSPGEGPQSEGYELDEMDRRHRAMIDVGNLRKPFDALRNGLNELHSKTGLRVGFAYTMLLQQASGGPGERLGTAGDIDIITRWTLLGRGTKDTGTLAFDGEYRFKVGDQPPSALGGVLGTLTNTTGGFNGRGWVVRDAYWLQRLFDDHLRLLVGRADVSDWVGGTQLQSINLFYLNRAFSANASVAFPNGHGPAAGASILPCEWFYVTGGAANAYNNTTTIEVDSLDQGDFFWFTEFGLTPRIAGLGQGRYKLLLWRMDEREELGLPEDQGLSLILEQDIGDQLLTFARYSYSDATLTNIQNAFQAGVGVRGWLGSADNVTGFAGSYAEPPSGGGRDEKVFEIFQRFQLLDSTQFTAGVQLIVDPSNNPSQDVLGVFSFRLRITF